MATVSRLPQRKKAGFSTKANTGKDKVKEKEVDTDVDSMTAQEVHAALAAIGYGAATVEDLERVLQGKFGEALRFLVAHVVGREKVAKVRNELHRLRQLPSIQTRGLFTPDTAVEQYTKAVAKLARTRTEVATRQREFAQLQAASEAAQRDLEKEQKALMHDRTTELLLRVLKRKEEGRVARVEHLHRILKDVREKGKTMALRGGGTFALTQSPLEEALAQIRDRLPHGSHAEPQPRAKGPINSNLITGATCSPGALDRLHARVQDSAARLAVLANEASSRPPPVRDDLLDQLTLLRTWNNTLKRTLPPDLPSLDYTLSALDDVLASSLGCAPADSQIAEHKKKLVASCEGRVHARLREERRVLFPDSVDLQPVGSEQLDLDAKHAIMKREHERVQGLLSLYRYLLESARRMNDRLRNQTEGPLLELEAECKEKGNILMGYVDVQRQRIVHRESDVSEDSRGDADIHAALGLAPATTQGETLKTIYNMVTQAAALRERLARKPEMAAPATDSHLIERFVEEQREMEGKTLALLTRKNEKMGMRHVLEKDIRRFLDEGEAIVAGKLNISGPKGG